MEDTRYHQRLPSLAYPFGCNNRFPHELKAEIEEIEVEEEEEKVRTLTENTRCCTRA